MLPAAPPEGGEHRQDEEEKDDEADEDQPADVAVVGAVALGPVGRGGLRGGFLGRELDLLRDRVDAGLYAARKVAVLELRRHDVADDPAR